MPVLHQKLRTPPPVNCPEEPNFWEKNAVINDYDQMTKEIADTTSINRAGRFMFGLIFRTFHLYTILNLNFNISHYVGDIIAVAERGEERFCANLH